MTRLIECRQGDKVKIKLIQAGRGAILNLAHLGLNIGDIIEFGRKSLLRGPVIIVYQGSEIAIGHGLAKKIFVENI